MGEEREGIALETAIQQRTRKGERSAAKVQGGSSRCEFEKEGGGRAPRRARRVGGMQHGPVAQQKLREEESNKKREKGGPREN